MTAALDALARIDDGIALPGDRTLADVFDQHCVWGQPVACLICGGENGPECGTCTATHDKAVERSADQ